MNQIVLYPMILYLLLHHPHHQEHVKISTLTIIMNYKISGLVPFIMRDSLKEDFLIMILKELNLFHPIMIQIIDSKYMNSLDKFVLVMLNWGDYMKKVHQHQFALQIQVMKLMPIILMDQALQNAMEISLMLKDLLSMLQFQKAMFL